MSSEVEIRAPAEQTEGTRSQILRWLKSVGESVTENEPLIELETDKVTVEVPSPGSGTLREILKQEQEEIGPGDLLGLIEGADVAGVSTAQVGVGSVAGAVASGDGLSAAAAVDAGRISGGAKSRAAHASLNAASSATSVAANSAGTSGVASATANGSQPVGAAAAGVQAAGPATHTLSPAVRRLLAERGLDASQVRGTGQGGRITVADVIAHGAASPASGQHAPANPAPGALGGSPDRTGTNGSAPGTAPHAFASNDVSASSSERTRSLDALGVDGLPASHASTGGADGSHRVPHTATRKRIAEHMVQSLLHTAPHVTTVFEADLTALLEHRQRNKDDFARRGAPLTFTAYFLQATVAAIRVVPEANSRWTDSALEVFDSMHIGVATALETGLVVPVLRDVQSLDLFETAKGLDDLVSRARDGHLTPADVRGGTFTISNHGVSGSLVATPIIINQPQSAILGVGKLEKRPVVITSDDGEDRIVIRPRCYVTLTIDHRVMDGHQANRFLQTFVERLATPE
jgi:2-oxoglutarate dehydrogenase E2 component (dihydrolipoamide succinyltransferase)